MKTALTLIRNTMSTMDHTATVLYRGKIYEVKYASCKSRLRTEAEYCLYSRNSRDSTLYVPARLCTPR